MSESTLTVVKVGGSLFDWPELGPRLTTWLQARRATYPHEATILVAGGGPAADWIRSIDRVHHLGDARAHELALHALDLTAAALARLVAGSTLVERIDQLGVGCDSRRPLIVVPRKMLLEIEQSGAAPLPASWDATSDTIAARIAAHLGARALVLMKSACATECTTLADAALRGIVDPMLPRSALSIPQVEIINLRADPPVCRVFQPSRSLA